MVTDLKSHIKGKVIFSHYQDGNLVYRCEDGFEFPVPVTDCGSARFLAEDKAMLFMRWIRKHHEVALTGGILTNPI